MSISELSPRRKQIFYRARHRGFKEADLIVGGFAAAYIEQLSEDELNAFEALLAFPDQDLYEWIIGRRPAPANVHGPVFDKLQQFNVAKSLA